MALTLLHRNPLHRKPNSGLGNIRSSPGDPSRNVDWVLLLLQSALATIGCFVIYSTSRTKQADPYQYVTRQVVFLIAAGQEVRASARSVGAAFGDRHVGAGGWGFGRRAPSGPRSAGLGAESAAAIQRSRARR